MIKLGTSTKFRKLVWKVLQENFEISSGRFSGTLWSSRLSSLNRNTPHLETEGRKGEMGWRICKLWHGFRLSFDWRLFRTAPQIIQRMNNCTNCPTFQMKFKLHKLSFLNFFILHELPGTRACFNFNYLTQAIPRFSWKFIIQAELTKVYCRQWENSATSFPPTAGVVDGLGRIKKINCFPRKLQVVCCCFLCFHLGAGRGKQEVKCVQLCPSRGQV